MMPSLHDVAHALGGSVRYDRTGPHVVAPGPGQQRNDRSLSAWVNGDRFGLYSHRGDDWRSLDAHVRDRCGLEPWRPTRPKRVPKTVPFGTRNMFVGESLAICCNRKHVTSEQFELLINDLRLRDDAMAAGGQYAREFGFTVAELEAAMQPAPRHYTADERAKIFNLTYAERMRLGLRRTGSIDLDKAGRERARRDRYNAKRRAARQAARAVSALASIEVPSSQKLVAKQEPSRERKEISPDSKTPTARDCCRELDSLESYRLWVSAEDGRDCRGDRIPRSERRRSCSSGRGSCRSCSRPRGPAKGKVRGKQTDPRVEAATRKDSGYRNECSRSLFAVAAHGGAYKKTFRNTLLDTTQGVYVPAEHFLVPSPTGCRSHRTSWYGAASTRAYELQRLGGADDARACAGLRSSLRASTDHGGDQQHHRDGGGLHHAKPP